MSVEKVAYQGWPNCYRVYNSVAELIVTSDVGPRVMRVGTPGGQNLFREDPALMGLGTGSDYRSYGGHRLWHAPESRPRCIMPDNDPCEVREIPGGVHAIQPLEIPTGIQKEMELTIDATTAHFKARHRLRNCGLWPVRLAPWALSVMAAGGVSIIPLPPRGVHPDNLLPNTRVIVWPYTDMTDPRFSFLRKYILLRQDAAAALPQKIGVSVTTGWTAYLLNGQLFLKKFGHKSGAEYPDFGVTVEVFTNKFMLELETLDAMMDLAPGATVEYDEEWFLHSGITLAEPTDAAIDAALAPVL